MELIKALLEQQPLMALFLTVAIGYLVGEINIGHILRANLKLVPASNV